MKIKTNSDLAKLDGFVQVVFTSGTKTNTVAPSPTRKIKGFYGFGADGMLLWVHQDDQKARPDLYKLVEVVEGEAFSASQQPAKRGRKPKKVEAE